MLKKITRLNVFLVCIFFFPQAIYSIRISDLGNESKQPQTQSHTDRKGDFSNIWVPYGASINYVPGENFLLTRALWHVHTNYSDGWNKANTIAKKARKKGYNVIFFSDHTDMIGDSGSYQKYMKEISGLNIDGEFVVFPGREITVGPTKNNACHLNAFSFSPTPYLYSSNYKAQDLPTVLGVLDKESSFYVANHVNDCPKWRYEIGKLHGMEFFNDIIFADFGYLKRLYIENLLSGWRGFIVGGVDYHIPHENIYRGWTSTYIFTKDMNRGSIYNSVREGRTIATTGELEIEEFSLSPTLFQYRVKGLDSITISGKLKFTNSQPADAAIYLVDPKGPPTGERYPLTKVKGTKSYTFSVKVSYVHSEERFFLEVPGFLITSPYDLKFEEVPKTKPTESTTSTPRVLRIVDAYFNDDGTINIESENDALFDSYRIYEICYKGNLIKGPNGAVAGCKGASFTIVVDNGKAITVDGGGSCSGFTIAPFVKDPKKDCIDTLKESYIFRIGENDYRAISLSMGDSTNVVVLTDDPNLNENTLFKVCDHDHLVINSSGIITDCQAEYTNIGIYWVDGKLLPRLNLWDSGVMILLSSHFYLVKQ